MDYYRLLELYEGDLSKATGEELKIAANRNPNNPVAARTIAENKYRKDYKRSKCCKARMVNGGVQCEACGSNGL